VTNYDNVNTCYKKRLTEYMCGWLHGNWVIWVPGNGTFFWIETLTDNATIAEEITCTLWQNGRSITKGEEMEAKPSIWIQYFSGTMDGFIMMPYKNRFGLNCVRKYKYPTEFTDQNQIFGDQCHAIAGTWNAAAEGFQADMATYEEAWNNTQHAGKLEERDRVDYALFIKACFGVADLTAFDLSTLTVDNFGGEAGDLLGTEAPNVGNLITAADMPACGLDLSTLNSPIEAV
jgi:hypothetical protein